MAKFVTGAQGSARHRSAVAVASVLVVLLIATSLWPVLHRRHPSSGVAAPTAFTQHEPTLMLWAWETPEDLTGLDTSRAGVAFLSRELILSTTLQVRPRRQPLRVPPHAWLMADVRIETTPAFVSSPQLVSQTAAAIAAVTQLPNVRAIQVDFDATYSQRPFYTAVLGELRPLVPPTTPISITALVSWCGSPSWLHSLPAHTLDEAVPMFFRMGGPASIRATRPKDISVVTEPLCSASIGIATDETWPTISPHQRVYLFRQGPWTKEDLALLHNSGYEHLQRVSPQ
jgi:hypothetical protein